MKYLLWIVTLILTCAPCLGGIAPSDSEHNTTKKAINIDDPRESMSLNGNWEIAFDPDDVGKQEKWFEYFPSNFATLRVPGVWNEIRPRYQGVAWYRRKFYASATWQGKSVRIRFDAVSYRAEIWLNGKYLGMHEGGYTPFDVEVDEHLLLNANNQLVVRVMLPGPTRESLPGLVHQLKGTDGIMLEETPTSKQNWYDNFGGIWQDVDLIISNRIRVEDCFIEPNIHTDTIDVQCQLNNHTNREAGVGIVLTAWGRKQREARKSSAAKDLRLPADSTTSVNILVSVANAILWSPSHPFLYTLRVALVQQAQTLDSTYFTFGMREFSIRDNRFFLNDHPIVLRGALYQPHYPETLAFPPDESWFAEDLRLAKNANLNLLRLHLKPQVPNLLDLADERGILLFEEPPIGWIRSSGQLRDRCRREVEQLVLRDRNHPSVVMWGILNEGGGAAQELKTELAALAHELDPTRPVLDDSGGFYWSGENSRAWTPAQQYPGEINDLHPYLSMPFNQEDFDYYRQLPEAHKLNFISEFGALGGMEDFASVIRSYSTERPWQDKATLKALYGHIQAGFREQGLETVFGTVAAFVKSSQKAQADALTQMIDALRINPQTAGYVITQLNDASVEGFYGLVDEWRHKKEAYAAAAEANRSLHLIVSGRASQYAGEPTALNATIVDDAERLGNIEMDVKLESTSGKVIYTTTRMTHLVGGVQALPVLHLVTPPDEGIYHLVATLKSGEQIVDQDEQDIVVLRRPSRDRGPITPVTLLDPRGNFTRLLGNFPLRLKNYKPDLPPQKVYLVGPIAASLFDYPLAQLKEIMESVRGGATLVALELPSDTEEVSRRFDLFPVPVKVTSSDVDAPAILFSTEWIRKHEITEGLPADRVMDQTYAEVLPKHFLEHATGQAIAGALENVLATEWFQSLVVTPIGKGHLIVCQLQLFEKLGRDPVADRLFINMIHYANSISTLPEAQSPSAHEAELEERMSAIRTHSQMDMQRWAVLGPLGDTALSGSYPKYAPDANVDLKRQYRGKSGTVQWEPVTVWNSQNDRVTLATRLDLTDWAHWYAYTEVYSPIERDGRFVLTCQSACRLWLNGEEIIDSNVILENWNSAPVCLHAGWNRILVKINKTQMPDAYFTLEALTHRGERIANLRFNFTRDSSIK